MKEREIINSFVVDFDYNYKECVWECRINLPNDYFEAEATTPIDAYELAERVLRQEMDFA